MMTSAVAPESQLSEQLEQMRKELASVKTAVFGENGQTSTSLLSRVTTLEKQVRGDKELGLNGLALRIETMETVLKALQDERKQQRNILVGIGIGLGFTGLSSIGTLITVLTQLAP